MAEHENLISLNEAAMALRMSRERTMRRLLRGEITGIQVAGRWFVDRRSLEARTAVQMTAKTA